MNTLIWIKFKLITTRIIFLILDLHCLLFKNYHIVSGVTNYNVVIWKYCFVSQSCHGQLDWLDIMCSAGRSIWWGVARQDALQTCLQKIDELEYRNVKKLVRDAVSWWCRSMLRACHPKVEWACYLESLHWSCAPSRLALRFHIRKISHYWVMS